MTKSISLQTVCTKRFDGLRRACRIFHPSQKGTAIILQIGILTMLAYSILSAQIAGKISGTITDPQTGESLIGANIMVLGTSLGASTDIDGTFFIINVPAGKYNVQVSMVGYEKVIQRDIIVNSGRTTTVDFKIKSSAIEQDAVIIEHERPDVEREKTSTSEIIRGDDVQQMAGMRDVGDVVKLAADVTDGHFRGGREGEELYTLQGMGIVNPLDNTTGFLPIMSAVEEVEVITSGFGAQYGNAQSGVVNITMKEGKSDKWRSHAEMNTRMPARKYFGANMFDANANTYLKTLLQDSVWNSPTASEDPGSGFWTNMGRNITNMFGRDTVLQVEMARMLWRQMRRNINNTDYDKKVDYTAEFSAGGPLSENIRLFFAVRNSTTWPEYPVEHPNVNRQIMGNIVTDIASGASLRISGAYGENNTTQFPSENSATSPGYLNYIWDHILDIQYRHLTNTQIGLRFTQALSQSTFYEIKLNTLLTRRKQGGSPFQDNLTDAQILNQMTYQGRMTLLQQKGPDGFNVGVGTDDYLDDRTNTYSVDASFTSQATKSHMVNIGIQGNLYYLNINEHRNMSADPPLYTVYTAKPYEVSVYLQDKMEFQGMIANIGLRWDLWDENVNYNPDLYAPYYIPQTIKTFNQQSDSVIYVYKGAGALTEKVPALGRLQPRIGLSFPVSITTVFHINYGAFLQRPSFQYVLDSRNYYNPLKGKDGLKASQLGNPALKPQTTYSYDVGVMQGLGEGFTLDVSGYYKNVQDLVQQATYSGEGGSFTTYVNRAYADIRGFRIVLNKRKGNFIGSVNYQYSVATGKSSTVGSMIPSFTRSMDPDTKDYSYTQNEANVAKKDILLDFDREHNLLINLGYVTEQDFGRSLGLQIGDVYPLGDVSVSTNSFVRSGRPYTYSSETGSSEVNNKRTPWEYNTNLKISKKMRKFFGVEATIYFEVFNLFDNKILNYDYIFLSNNAGVTNNNAKTYETTPLDAPSGLRYANDTRQADPRFALDKSFLIYSNEPRSFNFGFAVDF